MLTRTGFQHPCRNWEIPEFLLIMLYPQVSEALTPHPRSSFFTTDGAVMDGDTTESQNWPRWREQMTTGFPVPVDISTIQPYSWALGNIVEGKAEKWLEPENQKSAGRLCLLAMTSSQKHSCQNKTWTMAWVDTPQWMGESYKAPPLDEEAQAINGC